MLLNKHKLILSSGFLKHILIEKKAFFFVQVKDSFFLNPNFFSLSSKGNNFKLPLMLNGNDNYYLFFDNNYFLDNMYIFYNFFLEKKFFLMNVYFSSSFLNVNENNLYCFFSIMTKFIMYMYMYVYSFFYSFICLLKHFYFKLIFLLSKKW